MVVPVSGNLNFFPVSKGKKNTGRDAEKINFEDYLTAKVEPLDESPHPGEEKQENPQRRRIPAPDVHTAADGTEKNDSQGSDVDNPQSFPGRRIDLRA